MNRDPRGNLPGADLDPEKDTINYVKISIDPAVEGPFVGTSFININLREWRIRGRLRR